MSGYLKGFATFTRGQQAGILVLCLAIAGFQLIISFCDFTSAQAPSEEEKSWLALQQEIDREKKEQAEEKKFDYKFNPNFIDDFRGYQLGMTVEQIDRLLEFRKSGKFVNSAAEFQKVTGVPDSLLGVISARFRFPEWVAKRQSQPAKFGNYGNFQKPPTVKADINAATADDLIGLYGIGPALSGRILKMRESLGGFVSMEQMEDVWGLSPEVIASLKNRFEVKELPQVKKVRINQGSARDLGAFPYFRYPVSREIVVYRTMNGPIKDASELLKIKNFPSDRIDIISLYLEL